MATVQECIVLYIGHVKLRVNVRLSNTSVTKYSKTC